MDPSTNQDLYTLRAFVGGFNAALNDQSYAGADATVYNPVGQFQSVGPYGSSVEGQPVAVTGTGALRLSPGMTMLLLGAGLFWLYTTRG